MSRKATLNDQMKSHERVETSRRLDSSLPILARIDGKNFSNFTKGLKRPFDPRFSNIMIAVAKYLVKETNACMGYTQSDEITLAWYHPDEKSQAIFGGKVLKLNSILPSMATVKFYSLMINEIREKREKLPVFDCRVWNCPSLEEGANSFVWREEDGIENSILMAGRTFFSHKQMYKKSTRDVLGLLESKGIYWNNYPDFFKKGTFIQRRKVFKKFSFEELEKLPPKHHARQNPDLEIERNELRKLEIKTLAESNNKVDVVFFGKDPVYDE